MKKEELDKFLKIEGKVRGTVFQVDAKFVTSKLDKEGLEKLEKRAKSLGYEIPYETADVMGWYPIGLRMISLFLIKEVFNLKDQEMRKMGQVAPKFSFIVKFLFKLFAPLKKFTEDIPRYWEEHYTIGKLEVKESDEKKKRVVIHLKGIKLHPLFCLYLEGFFEGVGMFLYPTSKIKETKCMFKGNPFHEYILSW